MQLDKYERNGQIKFVEQIIEQTKTKSKKETDIKRKIVLNENVYE